MSFLTVTTLIYTIGARIIIATDTKLAFQLFFIKRFKLIG
ncbi:5970_t:CDS:2 [Funneliformis mosseae]|uniref:5970_t:CDS:1 n=1 Tax=Funneliformis mosseae TaxID=27381 RepID=A0A9N8W766_FUNMO|nr:5970_t:CDS:2 [Funneliformis mosseae]